MSSFDLDEFASGEFERPLYGGGYPALMHDIDATWELHGTVLDPTLFVSVIAKAVHHSCRLGLMRAIPYYDPYQDYDCDYD